MRVQAIIQAAGMGTRLGLGPKAFVQLGGRTLLEHAVHNLLDSVDHILAAVPADVLDEARRLCTGKPVEFIAGGKLRSETARLLVNRADADWLVLHDVVHPFVRAGIVKDLFAAALASGASAAAPGLFIPNFVYDRDGKVLFAPGCVQVAQKPLLINRAALLASYSLASGNFQLRDPSILEILQDAGHRVVFIPGSSHNFKITTLDDLNLARALFDISQDTQLPIQRG